MFISLHDFKVTSIFQINQEKLFLVFRYVWYSCKHNGPTTRGM